jgi:hypothetical protein
VKPDLSVCGLGSEIGNFVANSQAHGSTPFACISKTKLAGSAPGGALCERLMLATTGVDAKRAVPDRFSHCTISGSRQGPGIGGFVLLIGA